METSFLNNSINPSTDLTRKNIFFEKNNSKLDQINKINNNENETSSDLSNCCVYTNKHFEKKNYNKNNYFNKKLNN